MQRMGKGEDKESQGVEGGEQGGRGTEGGGDIRKEGIKKKINRRKGEGGGKWKGEDKEMQSKG